MANILLIEPDRMLADTYTSMLDSAGHSTVVCKSAQAAIMAADKQVPDIIILELQLVEHSGIEFLYELRSYTEWQDVPVIIQTFVPSGEFAMSRNLLTEELGVKAYLYKPISSLRTLMRKINEFTPIEA